MSSASHPQAGVVPEKRRWSAQLLVTEMWASLAITTMWVVVGVTAVWGQDLVATNGAGTNSTTVPSGVLVAIFATIGTWAVARYGFGRREER